MARSSFIVDLGGLHISLNRRLPGDRLLMVLGGRAPDPTWLAAFARESSAEVWAVDSGADVCQAAGLRPSLLIGDGDSASPEAWMWAVEGGATEKRYDSAKDLTDFQLALDCWREDADSHRKAPIITGCFGGRLDHLYSNLHSFFSMPKQGRSVCRCMIDDREGVFLLYSGEEAEFLFGEDPLAVSLLPLSNRCGGVSIDGVRWPLKNASLERRLPWAISNEVLIAGGSVKKRARVTVGCGRGVLGVYWCGKEGK